MNIHFRFLKENDRTTVSQLMNAFYTEDSFEKTPSSTDINNTFLELAKHPEKGHILIAENITQIIGYALLINYWSNEYAGNVVHLDELYIKPQYRKKGIGTQFLQYIISHPIQSSVAFKLEVTKHNRNAQRFYQKFGFKQSQYLRFILDCS